MIVHKGKDHFVHGEWITIREAAKKYNISIHAIRNRMYSKGLTLEEAVDYDPNDANKTNRGSLEWQQLRGGPRLSVDDI